MPDLRRSCVNMCTYRRWDVYSLSDNLTIVVDRWDESSWIDLKILRSTWDTEVDVDSLKLQAELLQNDLRSVCPWTEVGGVKCDLWCFD